MQFIKYPLPELLETLLQRPAANTANVSDLIEEIFDDIKRNGDKAIVYYTQKFDHVNIENPRVGQEKIENAIKEVSPQLKKAIGLAAQNIEKFHRSQVSNFDRITTSEGVTCWTESKPIEKVGIYIPGGTAPLFSTVLMLGIPALIAGCSEIQLFTPPDTNGEINPVILYVAQLIGIKKIYSIGGIQAIGAMTYGTQTISKVDKIFGPGNQYVTQAKIMAQNNGVAIDMPAGPSELLVIADRNSIPDFVAADLLSQAEHGIDSQVILLSDSETTIEMILKSLYKQLEKLPRKAIAEQSIQHSRAILLENITQCVSVSNQYAPEHLIIATDDAEEISKNVSNAGSVFLGKYSCESAGDYASGTNHTLPTNGFARNYSGVSVESFTKKIFFQELSEKGIVNLGEAIELMAEAEQLMAHKNAVSIRLEYLISKNNK